MAVTDDSLELLPLWPDQDEDSILARWQGWTNEGLDEDSTDWVDVRPGSFWAITTAAGIREAARLYDLIGSEYVAAVIPMWTWGEYMDDIGEGLNLLRLAAVAATGVVTFTGAEGTVIPAGTQVAVDSAGEDADSKEYQTTEAGTMDGSGSIDLPIRALTAGAAGNTSAATVTILQSGVVGLTAVTNADRITGGTDPESDEALRERLLSAYAGEGPGNAHDYVVWARAYGGVGRVVVIPLWDGPGTVLVIALTEEGQPVSTDTVAGLQAFLDPVAGKGSGEAPVGPTVTVATAELIDVTVTATVELLDGYSLDGSGGTLAVGPAITDAIRAHVESAVPGGEINVRKLIAAIVSVPGVNDVKDVAATAPDVDNEANGNISLTSDPALVAQLAAATLTVGTV